MEETALKQNQTPVQPQQPVVPVLPKKSPFMPKKTLALITILALVTVGLVGLAVYSNAPQITKIPNITNPKATNPSLQTTLALSSAVEANKENIQISTGTNKVTAVQLELSYDPKFLTNVDIAPGSFFNDPAVLLKKIDPETGTISLALGLGMGQKAISGTGTVAVLTFTPVAGQSGETAVNFLPKTQVTAQGYAQSVLKSITGSTISLTSASATLSSPSAH